MNNTDTIYKTLAKISGSLNGFVAQEENCGLLSGYCGTALFYAQYYKLTAQKKYLNSLNQIIEKTVQTLTTKEIMYSHCGGISGIAWGIQHLINDGFIEQDETADIFEEIDSMLFDIMKLELGSCRYDFLHEGLGIMLYFLEKMPDNKVQNYLKEGVLLLEKSVVKKDTGISWRDYSPGKILSNDHSVVYNLGLSHGVPAILSILSMVYEKGIETARVLPMIEDGVKWLLSSKNKPGDKCVSLYPTKVCEDAANAETKYSRLGWCYGDLSVAITLLNIGTRLKNEYYKQQANLIFEHTLFHRNIKNGHIVDASLCHGSMGVSHIYRRAYETSGNELFLRGANQWLQQTLAMATWKNGVHGFNYATQDGYQNNYNLLEGITGIGLGLITAVNKNTAPTWDRCLLLS